MAEEVLVSGAEIIQPVFSCRRLRKAVLGAFAVTGEAHIALLAVGRKRSSFGGAKARLL